MPMTVILWYTYEYYTVKLKATPPGYNDLKRAPEPLYCMFLDCLYGTRWESTLVNWRRTLLISWLKLGWRRDAIKSACIDQPLTHRWLISWPKLRWRKDAFKSPCTDLPLSYRWLISWLKLGWRRDALKCAFTDLPFIYRWLIPGPKLRWRRDALKSACTDLPLIYRCWSHDTSWGGGGMPLNLHALLCHWYIDADLMIQAEVEEGCL